MHCLTWHDQQGGASAFGVRYPGGFFCFGLGVTAPAVSHIPRTLVFLFSCCAFSKIMSLLRRDPDRMENMP